MFNLSIRSLESNFSKIHSALFVNLQYAPTGQNIISDTLPGHSIQDSVGITVAMSNTLTKFITVQPRQNGNTDRYMYIPQMADTIGHGLHYCMNFLDRVSTKPGLWTLDCTMDWTVDWTMDSIVLCHLNAGLLNEQEIGIAEERTCVQPSARLAGLFKPSLCSYNLATQLAGKNSQELHYNAFGGKKSLQRSRLQLNPGGCEMLLPLSH